MSFLRLILDLFELSYFGFFSDGQLVLIFFSFSLHLQPLLSESSIKFSFIDIFFSVSFFFLFLNDLLLSEYFGLVLCDLDLLVSVVDVLSGLDFDFFLLEGGVTVELFLSLEVLGLGLLFGVLGISEKLLLSDFMLIFCLCLTILRISIKLLLLNLLVILCLLPLKFRISD